MLRLMAGAKGRRATRLSLLRVPRAVGSSGCNGFKIFKWSIDLASPLLSLAQNWLFKCPFDSQLQMSPSSEPIASCIHTSEKIQNSFYTNVWKHLGTIFAVFRFKLQPLSFDVGSLLMTCQFWVALFWPLASHSGSCLHFVWCRFMLIPIIFPKLLVSIKMYYVYI